MNALEGLAQCAGEWRGKSTLYLHEQPSSESVSTATVTPLLGGRFVRFDYTWEYEGKPQEGSILFGFDENKPSGYWIDSWHMGRKALLCAGTGEALKVRGSYAAPPGPDWGWTIEAVPESDGTLRLIMFNVWPNDEREDLAVQASYTRA